MLCRNFSRRFYRVKWLPAKREFDYQKDQEFVGGFTRVFHVYGKFLQ